MFGVMKLVDKANGYIFGDLDLTPEQLAQSMQV